MPPNDQSRPAEGGSSDQVIADDDDTAILSPASTANANATPRPRRSVTPATVTPELNELR
jgi:hypothetical protein